MSDYISKSALIGEMTKGKEVIKDRLDDISVSGIYATIEEVIEEIDRQPTLDEKEIIRKPMERIIERIENARQKYQRLCKEQGEKEDEAMNIHFRGVMQIVKEEGGIQ